jgi:GT2 family glycosyltransferase
MSVPTAEPRATVVLPVLDAASYLPSLLAALAGQDVALEVLAIDSGSRDASVALLREAGARVIPIERTRFDHGETRNLGAREAACEIVLFLSQDALPQGASYARLLIESLECGPRLAGTFARQVPRPEADPLTRRDLACWVAASAEPRTVFLSEGVRLEALDPLSRHRLTAFDNVASAVRRSVLLAHPFGATRFGEDLEWGARILTHGYGIRYLPEAVVVHSHRRSARGLYRRNYLTHRALFRVFGLRTIPSAAELMRAVAGSLWSDLVTLAREGGRASQLLSAPAQALAAAWGQYRGVRDEARQRPYPAWA